MFWDQDRLVRADLRTPIDGLTEEAAGAGDSARRRPSCQTSRCTADFLEDFIQAIETNRTPICDGREGRRSVEVVSGDLCVGANGTV